MAAVSKNILIPLPEVDFDPTEAGVPWDVLVRAGHRITFATPTGKPGKADPRMLTGNGLGPLRIILMADRRARMIYSALERSTEFQRPIRYERIRSADFDALVLPGGHALGMKAYLESKLLQNIVGEFFENQKPVGAICHGVVLAARSRSKQTGKSVLWGRKTTALTRRQELLAWNLTRARLGDYYRTYPTPADFLRGNFGLFRGSPERLSRGFAVRDGNYVSARWPGDAHRFAAEFNEVLESR